MNKKYWVPALERASLVLGKISEQPSRLRLIDLANELEINKSSMFSLLQTLEALRWIVKEKGDTYALGPELGKLGSAFFRQYDLVEAFRKEGLASREKIDEIIQLGKRENNQVFYLDKLEASTPLRLLSAPGMTFPAHATGLGKVLLAVLDDEELSSMYPDGELPAITSKTITTLKDLQQELIQVRAEGCGYDREEAVEGFFCVAAPIYGAGGEIVAAVSFSMPSSRWAHKQDAAREEIKQLARRLSTS